MPPVAAMGASLATAAGAAGITAAGVATGLSVVGTGLGLIGQLTGNKTLSTIGLGMGAAGAATGLAVGLKGAAGAGASALASGKKTGISGSNAKTTKTLDVDNIEQSLAQNNARSMDDLKSFKPVDTQSTSMDAYKQSADSFTKGAQNMNILDSMNDPANQQSFLKRAGNTLQKYDTTAYMAMGAGKAYMDTRGIKANKDMQQKELDFEREQIARQERNLSVPTSPGSPQVRRPRFTRTPGDPRTAGILQNRRF